MRMKILISILVFLIGTMVGIFLMGICKVSQTRIPENNGLIPIEYEEPKLGSRCVVQITGQLSENVKAHSAFFMAWYTDEGWIIDGYEEATEFTVEAWCYTPDPIEEVMK